MRNKPGLSLLGTIVIVIVVFFVILLIFPILLILSGGANKLVCGTNLKGLGNAIYVYAFDYEDVGPVLGWEDSQWGVTTSGWNKKERDFSAKGGTTTIASSLYLLIRDAGVGAKSFVCPDGDETEFENPTSLEYVDLWDFGGNPKRHVSYSYQWPYGKYSATTSGNSSNAIMADRNPWFDDTLTRQDATEENYLETISLIDLAENLNNMSRIQVGNSSPRNRFGQHVVFGDGHTAFEKRADVGTDKDNIYTIGGETEKEKRIGTAPVGMKFDAFDENDSLLINDR